MLVLINNARQEYYSNLVAENCHDQAKFLKVSKTLLNLQADNMLPPHDNASSLAHEMGEYFVHKISTIRSKLDSHSPQVSHLLLCLPNVIMALTYLSLTAFPMTT